MTTTPAKAAVGALFALIFSFGFWLSRAGKPYNAVVVSVHKLLALGALVLVIVVVARGARAVALPPLQVAAAVLMFLAFAALFATGALLSLAAGGRLEALGQPAPMAMQVAHRVVPYVALVATAGTLLLGRPS